ncbi:S8 family peptidase [Streptomyces sp. 900116325]
MWERRLAVGLIVPVLCVSGIVSPSRAEARAPALKLGQARDAGYDLTLVTGDRVHVSADKAVNVTPADRGDGAGHNFEVLERDGGLYVVPDDVSRLVPDHLDPELFNVTALHAQGFDGSVPLIVTYGSVGKSAVADRPTTLPATTQVRLLESVNGTAVRTEPRTAARLGAALARSGRAAGPSAARTLDAGPLAGVEKIWLDAKVHADTAKGTARKAAATSPAAEAANDGSGVTVAVLDTGIDATHPDLSVEAAKNFSADADTVDHNGHGTYVASILAGSGAASDGRYRGVAPGVTLLIGKVLDGGGDGSLSGIIDGMEWAAGEEHASVINMSFADIDAGGPMTDAVNSLTDRYGALFVVEAGENSQIGSPGDAARALTVGAVDQTGAILDDSGHGPINGAIKPDVTALGVGIVGAHAAGTQWGIPVTDEYTTWQGTLAATPVVAGTTALVLQARPKTPVTELRSLLMGTAEPNATTAMDTQGAGQVNAAKAIAGSVTASTGSLAFGRFSYPHTGQDPVKRVITYRNLTGQPLPLKLGLSEKGLEVTPSTLMVPANGTADATVVLDPAVAQGRVAAALTAAAPDGFVQLRTLLSADVEVEHYNIRLKGIARDGRPARGDVDVLDVVNGDRTHAHRLLSGDPNLPCTDAGWADSSCIRVVPGKYSVMGLIKTMPSWQDSTADGTPQNVSLVGDPEVTVTKDTEIVLDARKAKEVKIETPENVTKRNDQALSLVAWSRIPESGAPVEAKYRSYAMQEQRVFMQPTERVRTGSFEAYTKWTLEAPHITMRTAGVTLDPDYYPPAYFSDYSWEFPRLDGIARMPVVDAGLGRASDLAGHDLRGKLALIRRSDEIPVAEQSNNAAAAGARMVAVYNDKPGINVSPGGPVALLKVPTVRLSHEEGRALLARRSPVVTTEGIVRSPYVYDLLLPETGRIRDDLRYVEHTRDLARIDTDYHDPARGDMSAGRYGRRPWESYAVSMTRLMAGAPRTRVEYVSADPDTRWTGFATLPEYRYGLSVPDDETPTLFFIEPRTVSYRPGKHTATSWFNGPLVPRENILDETRRSGDQLRLYMGVLTDTAHNYGDVETMDGGIDTSFRMYKNDELIGTAKQQPIGYVGMSPENAEYRFEYDYDNHAPWARLTTRTRTAWSFHSQRPSGDADVILPLLMIDYDANLDLRDHARSGALNLNVRHQAGAPATPVKNVSLAVSYDDGSTWADQKLKRKGTGYTASLHGKGSVSLRVRAEDVAGNTISEEVIRAYELR